MNNLITTIFLFLVVFLPYNGFAQDGNFRVIRAEDSITSQNRGDNLILLGRGKGVVEVRDTLKIKDLVITGGENGGQISIDGNNLVDFIRSAADGSLRITGAKYSPIVVISTDSRKGYDNKSITITPAGGLSELTDPLGPDSRGPSISGYATQFNVDANLRGILEYRAGNVKTGKHNFYTQGYRRLNIGYNGDINAYGNNLLDIGGSPLSGNIGVDRGEGTHGGIDIIGNGLQTTHIQFRRDDQVMTIGAKLFSPVTSTGVDANGPYIEIQTNNAGGNIKFVAGGVTGFTVLKNRGIKAPGITGSGFVYKESDGLLTRRAAGVSYKYHYLAI